MSSPSNTPRFSLEGGVARITLARPEHRNRLHNEDLTALMGLFERINQDRAIRVLVLSADVLPNRPVFSAGYNIAEFDAGKPAVGFEEVTDALEALRVVTICALNGSVYGGASDVPLACDLTVGVEGIEMRVPAAALGLHYYPSGLARFVSRLGVSTAKRLLLAAEALDATTLLRVGYVQELLPQSAFEDRVEALARQIGCLAPLAQETMKRTLNELARGDFDRERILKRVLAAETSEDFAEGRRAYAERRTPSWKGY
jgi:enoyl-CoA hydratase/carnithine racemase